MEPIRNAQGAAIQHFIESMPATSHLGIEVVSIGDGRCVLDLPCARDITVDGRIVQGGIVAVVADYAAVAAAGSTLGEGWSVATLSCETHNLLPAQGEKLVAVGEIIKGSTRHLVAKADVHLDTIDGAVCLTGLFTARALEVDLPGGVGKQPASPLGMDAIRLTVEHPTSRNDSFSLITSWDTGIETVLRLA